MAAEKVQGLAETYALFYRIPGDARDQLGVELAIISRDILAAQRAAAPSATGQLRAGLSIALLLDQLKTRIGIIGQRGGKVRGKQRGRNLGDLFYGRFVELGRKAQTVLVQRRRRVSGRLRSARGRKVAADIATTYSLKVKARDPRPFVQIAGAEQLAIGQLAEFWSRVLARSGAA